MSLRRVLLLLLIFILDGITATLFFANHSTTLTLSLQLVNVITMYYLYTQRLFAYLLVG